MGSVQAALITGATSGIGRELSILIARDGHDLVLVARTEPSLSVLARQLEQEHRVQTLVIVQDLSEADAASHVREAVKASGLSIGTLVNNAGAGLFGEFAAQDIVRVRQLIALNVTSLVDLTRFFLPDMREAGSGRILNVASTAAFVPGPYQAIYYASKAFVLSFSQALGEELRGSGITVTALCPGPTATAFQRRARVGRSTVTDWLMMDARSVARAGYVGMRRGQAVVIPGAGNKAVPQLARMLPRRLVASLARRLADSRRKEAGS